jgi:type 1 fimbria pilin
MKKLALLPLTLMFAANAALAANSVDLRVTGTITPSACDISLAGGDFDLGIIPVSDLSTSGVSARQPVGGKTLSITCSGATMVGLKAIDNRASSLPSGASSEDAFGLGMDGANNPIGSYTIDLVQAGAQVNGAGAVFADTDNMGQSWRYYGNQDVFPMTAYNNYPRVFSMAPQTGGGVIPVTSMSTQLQVSATIQPKSALDTSSEITIDGSATIELVYL